MDFSMWQMIIIITFIALMIYFRDYVYKGIQIASNVAKKGFNVSKQGFEITKKGYQWSAGKVLEGKQYLKDREKAAKDKVIKEYLKQEGVAEKAAETKLRKNIAKFEEQESKYIEEELKKAGDEMMKWATSSSQDKERIADMRNTLREVRHPTYPMEKKKEFLSDFRRQGYQMVDDAGVVQRYKVEGWKGATKAALSKLPGVRLMV